MKNNFSRIEITGGVNITVIIVFALVILGIMLLLSRFNVEQSFMTKKPELTPTPTLSDFKWK